MLKAFAAAAGLLTVAHSPTLTAALIPAAAAFVAAEVACVATLIYRRRTVR